MKKKSLIATLLSRAWQNENPPWHHKKVDKEDNIRYYNKKNQPHREDGPAVEYSNGTKAWCRNGLLHRTDGPAVEYPSGTKQWYVNDEFFGKSTEGYTQKQFEKDLRDLGITSSLKLAWQNENQPWFNRRINEADIRYYNEKGLLHKLDGPAVEYPNGIKAWYQNGELHRLDGPAIEYPNGDKSWYQNGKYHRLDGPATENINGDKYWYQEGQLHRTDGPAVEYSDGTKRWWVNGKYFGNSAEGYTQEEFENDLASITSSLKFKSWRTPKYPQLGDYVKDYGGNFHKIIKVSDNYAAVEQYDETGIAADMINADDNDETIPPGYRRDLHGDFVPILYIATRPLFRNNYVGDADSYVFLYGEEGVTEATPEEIKDNYLE